MASLSSGSESEAYQVKEILKQRKRKGILEYLVRWEGFGEGEDSWEPSKSLVSCVDAIKKFEQAQDALKSKKTSRSRSKGRARSRSRARSKSKGRSKSKTRSSAKTKSNSSSLVVLSSDDEADSAISTPRRQSRRTEVVTRTQTEKEPGRIETRTSVMKVTTNDDEPDNIKTTTVLREKRELKTVENNMPPVTASMSETSKRFTDRIWNHLDTAVLIIFLCISVIALSFVVEKYFDPEAIRKSVLKAYKSSSSYVVSQWTAIRKMTQKVWEDTAQTAKKGK